jgi:NADH:ubiquinone oxidoreductase subunit K
LNLFFSAYIIAVVLLLAIGLYSLFRTRNLMRVLISVEILMKAVTLLFIGSGHITSNMASVQAYVVVIIIIEVVLLVIATGIIVGSYRKNRTLDTSKLNNLKG